MHADFTSGDGGQKSNIDVVLCSSSNAERLKTLPEG